MKTLRFSSQYKKDVKKFRHQPKKMEKVLKILQMLRDEIPIPEIYKPHMLTGNYKGCMECHVEGDFLLIWIDETEDVIGVLRLGSHSELF
ncbi:MAG: type II toxin-antitoxin system YafQ family toxin [Muribaculaceae bacterium]|nr:type II toxin-antitoxin system YafQ family toxin [Muribaculaceae bacterium]